MPAHRSHDDRPDTELAGVLPEPEPDEAVTMTAIALAESGGSSGSTGEDPRGLWSDDVDAPHDADAPMGRGDAPVRGVGGDPGAGLDGLDETAPATVADGAPDPDPPAAFGAPVPEVDDVPVRSFDDPGATGSEGADAVPEVDDEVLVAFASGDSAATPGSSAYEPEPFAAATFAGAGDDADGVDPSPAWSTDPELAD
jgi:hypothetical protein